MERVVHILGKRGRAGIARALFSSGDDYVDAEKYWICVIVLDQFSRNMYRGERKAYASDSKALIAARHAIALGSDAPLSPEEQMFLYMPFMHSEDLGNQEQSVKLFRSQGAEALHYAEKHRDIILRFGRFPHRNGILGRLSNVDELRFLQAPDSSFAA